MVQLSSQVFYLQGLVWYVCSKLQEGGFKQTIPESSPGVEYASSFDWPAICVHAMLSDPLMEESDLPELRSCADFAVCLHARLADWLLLFLVCHRLGTGSRWCPG